MAKPYARDLPERSACPKKVARPFSLPACSNSLILSCVLIDQMDPFDRDTLQNAKTLRLLGAQGRNRTTDTVIFSHVLYQLSYLGAAGI